MSSTNVAVAPGAGLNPGVGRLVACGLIVAVYLPSLVWLGEYWWANFDHFIGVIAPVVAATVVVMRWPLVRSEPFTPSKLPVLLIVPGLALHLLAMAGAEYVWSLVSLPLTLHGCALLTLGRDRTRHIAFPIWFLLFGFPIFEALEIYLSFPMRIISTVLAEGMLTPFFEVTRSGTTLFTPNIEVSVIPACSGLNYLSTLLMLGVAFAWLGDSRITNRVSLLLLTPLIVLLANGLRVATVGVIGSHFGREAALGFFHDFSGILVFVVAVLGMVGASTLLARWLPDPARASA